MQRNSLKKGNQKFVMEENKITPDQEKQSQKKKRKWIILLILLLLVMLGFGGCYAWKYYTVQKPDEDLRKELYAEVGLMPGMTEDEIQARLNQKVKEGYFNASMNGTPTFANGRAEGNVNIENVPGNRYAFTTTVMVKDVDTEKYPEAAKYIGQTVLTTGLMEPNSFLTKKKLDVALPKGEYLCTVTFTVYDKDAGESDAERKIQGRTDMEIVLSVES